MPYIDPRHGTPEAVHLQLPDQSLLLQYSRERLQTFSKNAPND